MRVLSIDLDYIMAPSIEIIYGMFHDENPSTRWRNLYEGTSIRDHHLQIDTTNLMFCYNLFLKSLKKSKSVSFGYDHDDILYYIDKFQDIDLINIDHHDDVFSGDFTNLCKTQDESIGKEYGEIINSNRVHEGNWIAWLASKNKINSCLWVRNENSRNVKRNPYNEKIVPNYSDCLKEEFNLDNYNFDHIFVCLSPQYIPQIHWHYFSMFITAYEEFTGKGASILSWATKKYELELRHSKVTDEILHQCSNGR